MIGQQTMQANRPLSLATLLALAVAGAGAASPTQAQETHWSGYGELHLNYETRDDRADDPAPVLDFHRFVLGMHHAWDEQWSVTSELEIEHNWIEGGEGGELALEQAFLEWRGGEQLAARAGVLLLPLGLTNTEHEPATFLSVERPRYAKVVTPTTWYANGMQLLGNLPGGMEWTATLVEGLDGNGFDGKQGVREGRRHGFKASTGTLLGGLALDWRGLEGLRLGSSWYRSQLMDNSAAEPQPYERVDIAEGHLRLKRAGLWLTAEASLLLYAPLSESPELLERSWGSYVELGYDLGRPLGWESALVPFVRVEQDNMGWRRVSGTSSATEHQGLLAGVAWFPRPQIALKLDGGWATDGVADSEVRSTQLNAGAGYAF